jgi:NADH:ubiquinone oxidoreductase subunit F (NADH-binding)
MIWYGMILGGEHAGVYVYYIYIYIYIYQAADALERAVNRVLDDGLRTADLARDNTIGCRQVGRGGGHYF